MRPLPRHRRARPHARGMTLIELLVVVTIILILGVTVLPTIAGNAESRRSREVARGVSGFVARAQSRSIGRSQWAGFLILTTGTGAAGVDILPVDVPEPYRGDSATAVVTVASPAGPTTGTASAAAGDLSAASLTSIINTSTNDLIRFDGRGPTFEIVSGTNLPVVFRPRGNVTGTTSGGTGGEDLGQSPLNTPWPTPGNHSFEIFSQPIPAGTPYTLPESRVIDVSWSGFGPRNNYLTFPSMVAPVAGVTVLFDGTGRLRQVMVNRVRRTVTGPLFLLVGRADRAGQSYAVPSATDDSVGANWQYADSTWIAIDPMTGVVKSAECTPGEANVVASQTWIRQSLLGTGQ
ncbi:MAG: type II secretion system protein [Planctomycetia bacterium]|nr:type II secretion system protein [Planctomycetia bacterium]